jgi:MFS family permease
MASTLSSLTLPLAGAFNLSVDIIKRYPTDSRSRLVYGVDTGIVATTIAHDSFKLYMYNTLDVPSELTGAIVSCYYAGNWIGSFGSGFLMDLWGRKSLVYCRQLSPLLAPPSRPAPSTLA